MKSFEDIEKMVQDSRVQATRGTDERILKDLQNPTEGETSTEPTQHHHRSLTWIYKVAAVVIVGLALLSVLMSPPHGILPESIVMADIQQAVADQNGVYAQGTRICTFPATADGPEEVYVYQTEKWASDAGYRDITTDTNGNPDLEVCYHFESGTLTMVYHFAQQYYRFQVPPAYRERLQDMTLLGLLELLFQSGDYTELDPTAMHGIKALGFEVANIDKRLDQTLTPTWMRFFFLNFTESLMQLWVDPQTRLPILLQGDFTLDGCLFSDFTTMGLREVNDQWQWNVSLDEAMLLPEAPEGYKDMSLPNP